MNEKQAAELLEKYRAGTCTPEELRLVRRAFLGFPLAEIPPATNAEYDEWKAEAWERLTKRTQPKLRIIRWLPYAAAVVLVATVAWFVISRQQSAVVTDLAIVAPGGNRATLTLADGRVINLDEAQAGIVVGTENITYTDGSNLELSHLEGGRGVTETTELLSLTTPKGGTYQITLPDGSRVWLNANSTLKYPSRFSGDSRDVILQGEAYFDIEPVLSPSGGGRGRLSFKVTTAGQTVEVLGTQFNISAYADDPDTKTTLVEGKVAVQVNGTSLNLVPGEQSVSSGKDLRKQQVDTEQYASWKDGYFVLRGTIPELLKQLGRWYDIDVVYSGSQTDTVAFYATLQRDVPLADLLDTWKHYDPGLQFSVEEIQSGSTNKAGRRLTIFRK